MPLLCLKVRLEKASLDFKQRSLAIQLMKSCLSTKTHFICHLKINLEFYKHKKTSIVNQYSTRLTNQVFVDQYRGIIAFNLRLQFKISQAHSNQRSLKMIMQLLVIPHSQI
jgi:hypothetical protein